LASLTGRVGPASPAPSRTGRRTVRPGRDVGRPDGLFESLPEPSGHDKKEEGLRFHKTSSLVRWKGLSRALADSPQDCPPRPGRKAAGRAVRVPSGDFRKRQKKKRFLVSLEPLLWCSGTFG